MCIKFKTAIWRKKTSMHMTGCLKCKCGCNRAKRKTHGTGIYTHGTVNSNQRWKKVVLMKFWNFWKFYWSIALCTLKIVSKRHRFSHSWGHTHRDKSCIPIVQKREEKCGRFTAHVWTFIWCRFLFCMPTMSSLCEIWHRNADESMLGVGDFVTRNSLNSISHQQLHTDTQIALIDTQF